MNIFHIDDDDLSRHYDEQTNNTRSRWLSVMHSNAIFLVQTHKRNAVSPHAFVYLFLVRSVGGDRLRRD